MFGLGLFHFGVITVLTVLFGFFLICFFDVWTWWKSLLIFMGSFVIFTLILVFSVATEERGRHTTQTAQQVISHFIEVVHGGQLESDLWTLNRVAESRRHTAVPIEIIWLELLVWLTLQEYDITHNQIRWELERGRISIEPYVNISGLREVLNE